MMMDRNLIIEKIRKILALAENNPSEEEAVAAASKAQKMMAKYAIEEREIGEAITEESINYLECILSGKIQKWRVQLALALGNNFRCKVLMVHGNVAFYGYDSDVRICSEVFKSLYSIGSKLSEKAKRQARAKYGTATGIRNSFCLGFVAGVKSALDKQCMALMIVVPEKVEKKFEEDLFRNQNNKAKTYNPKLSGNIDSKVFSEGFIKGKNAMNSRYIEAT